MKKYVTYNDEIEIKLEIVLRNFIINRKNIQINIINITYNTIKFKNGMEESYFDFLYSINT